MQKVTFINLNKWSKKASNFNNMEANKTETIVTAKASSIRPKTREPDFEEFITGDFCTGVSVSNYFLERSPSRMCPFTEVSILNMSH